MFFNIKAGVESDRSANCATTTAHAKVLILSPQIEQICSTMDHRVFRFQPDGSA